MNPIISMNHSVRHPDNIRDLSFDKKNHCVELCEGIAQHIADENKYIEWVNAGPDDNDSFYEYAKKMHAEIGKAAHWVAEYREKVASRHADWWYELEALKEQADWLDEQATRESVRP